MGTELGSTNWRRERHHIHSMRHDQNDLSFVDFAVAILDITFSIESHYASGSLHASKTTLKVTTSCHERLGSSTISKSSTGEAYDDSRGAMNWERLESGLHASLMEVDQRNLRSEEVPVCLNGNIPRLNIHRLQQAMLAIFLAVCEMDFYYGPFLLRR